MKSKKIAKKSVEESVLCRTLFGYVICVSVDGRFTAWLAAWLACRSHPRFGTHWSKLRFNAKSISLCVLDKLRINAAVICICGWSSFAGWCIFGMTWWEGLWCGPCDTLLSCFSNPFGQKTKLLFLQCSYCFISSFVTMCPRYLGSQSLLKDSKMIFFHVLGVGLFCRRI